MWTAITLSRLGGCPGWSESSLGAQVISLVLSCGVQVFFVTRQLKESCFRKMCINSVVFSVAVYSISVQQPVWETLLPPSVCEEPTTLPPWLLPSGLDQGNPWFCCIKLGRVKQIWFLSPMRAAKVQASLRIRAVSPEPPLLAHTSSELRGTFRQKARSLAPLNGWACAVKICHDGMLEDTNSLDAAQLMSVNNVYCNPRFVMIRCSIVD